MFKMYFLSLVFFSSVIVKAHQDNRSFNFGGPDDFEKISVLEGESLNLAIKGKAWVENAEFVKAASTSNGFQLEGIKPGELEIRIGDKQFWLSVISRSQAITYNILKDYTKKSFGLKLVGRHGQIYIVGKLLRIKDWLRIADKCLEIHCEYKFAASLSTEIQAIVQAEFQSRLNQLGAYPYKIEFSPIAQIHLPQKIEQFAKIKSLADQFGIQIVTEASALELKPIVKVQITVAEVKKSAFQQLGVMWPDSYQATIQPGGTSGFQPFNVAMAALEQSGNGRILASPNIICLSGKEAEFLAGGELPIKVINYKIQDIIWKRYGISMKVKPLADFSGRMSISIETEVSSIDGAHTVDGIPAIAINRVQSHFDLLETQTIILSGLLKKEEHNQISGFPGLGQIPILGKLFSSENFKNDESELLIFVRPEIVKSQNSDREVARAEF